jgi:hypothetical protein
MFVGRESAQGFQPPGMIVGVDEKLKVGAQLFVCVLVVALDRGVLDGAVHSLDLPAIRHDDLGALTSR